MHRTKSGSISSTTPFSTIWRLYEKFGSLNHNAFMSTGQNARHASLLPCGRTNQVSEVFGISLRPWMRTFKIFHSHFCLASYWSVLSMPRLDYTHTHSCSNGADILSCKYLSSVSTSICLYLFILGIITLDVHKLRICSCPFPRL